MRTPALVLRAFCISAAAVFVACDGSQPLIGAPGAMPQTRAAESAARLSAMPLPKRAPLLYVVTDSNAFYILDYATGKIKQFITFTPNGYGTGACSDTSGNVFITEYGLYDSIVQGEILKYEHGAKAPIEVFDEDNVSPTSCAVDHTTGNLAVTNVGLSSGDVAIYPEAQGPPSIYTDPDFTRYIGSTYDNNGNLFIIGYGEGQSSSIGLAELPYRGSTFVNITLDKQIDGTRIQWDGEYFAITNPAPHRRSSVEVYRISVSGSSGTVVNTVTFFGASGYLAGLASLIASGKVILTLHRGEIGVYKYPAGGHVLRRLEPTGYRKTGLALSN